MTRPLWFMAGASAGAYAVVKARRAAEMLTPEGLHDRFAGLSLGWHMFTDEVRSGMQAKESELRERHRIGLDGPARLASSGKHTRIEGSGFEPPRRDGTAHQLDSHRAKTHRAEGTEQN